MFNELKTAQASAYLLHKAGGTMEHLKLMKLLYLADRLSWKEYDKSITGEEYEPYSRGNTTTIKRECDRMG